MAEQLNTGGGEFDPCRYRLRLPDRTQQQCCPVHRRCGHAAVPAHHAGQGAHLPCIFLRLHRAHHLWRGDLGHASHHGGPGLLRPALCAHQPAHPLARHGADPASAAAHRDRPCDHGHRPRAGAHGRQDGPGAERTGHAPGDGHEHIHGLAGRDRGRLPAGARHAACRNSHGSRCSSSSR